MHFLLDAHIPRRLCDFVCRHVDGDNLSLEPVDVKHPCRISRACARVDTESLLFHRRLLRATTSEACFPEKLLEFNAGLLGGAADLELHAVGIAEEERPLLTKLLDVADLLGPGGDETVTHGF